MRIVVFLWGLCLLFKYIDVIEHMRRLLKNRQSVWVNLANATGPDSICLSMSTPTDPFRTCLTGVPTFDPNQFKGWVSKSEILNKAEVITFAKLTWPHLMVLKNWQTLKKGFP